jgi:hypothetical protein
MLPIPTLPKPLPTPRHPDVLDELRDVWGEIAAYCPQRDPKHAERTPQ